MAGTGTSKPFDAGVARQGMDRHGVAWRREHSTRRDAARRRWRGKESQARLGVGRGSERQRRRDQARCEVARHGMAGLGNAGTDSTTQERGND